MSHFTVALKLKDYIRGGLYRSGSLTLNFSVFRHLKRASLLAVYLPWLLLITWLIICKHQSALCTLLNTPFNQPLFIVLSFTLANVTEVFLCFLLLSCFTASSFFISPQFPSRCVGVCVCSCMWACSSKCILGSRADTWVHLTWSWRTGGSYTI